MIQISIRALGCCPARVMLAVARYSCDSAVGEIQDSFRISRYRNI